MQYMLDTNVAIHTIRRRLREVRPKFIAQQRRMCILTVSLMELVYGAEKSAQPDSNLRDFEAFVSRLPDGCLAASIGAGGHQVRRRAQPGGTHRGRECRSGASPCRRPGQARGHPGTARTVPEERRQGRAIRGRLEILEAGDPLLGPATLWTGMTPYIATRNLKKRDHPASVVKAVVLAECRRRGLPSPAEVEVLDVRSGLRGGRPAAMLELRYTTAVRGPMLLGRDSHTGGGLFRAVSCQE